MLAIPGLWMPPNAPDVIRSPSCGRPESKFWLAARAKAEVVIPDNLGNDRDRPFRRVPSEFYACLPPELLRSIKCALLGSVAIAEQALRRSGPGERPKGSKQELL